MSRDFGKISTTLWQSKKFRKLESDKARLLYVYLHTNPLGNGAGCFQLFPEFGTKQLGWSLEEYRENLHALEIADLIEVDWTEDGILINNFLTFSPPTNPKHALGLIRHIEKVPSEHLVAKRLSELKPLVIGYRKALERLSKGYREGIRTETETETETKTIMESDKPDSKTAGRARESRRRSPKTAQKAKPLTARSPSPAKRAREPTERSKGSLLETDFLRGRT